MGIRNSSLTRVQPVLNCLHASDPTGESWLVPLIQSASLSECIPPGFNTGPLSEPPQFEFPAPPPRRFLRFLLENYAALRPPPEKVWARWSQKTQAKRRAFLANDAQIREEGLACLENARSVSHNPWWRFEGCTMVDCALFTQNCVIFIEGKRTEVGPSGEVTWWAGRNQVIRNVECALEVAAEKHLAHAFVLLVLEEDLCRPGSDRSRQAQAITSSECIAQSLPHLDGAGRNRIMSHYLGWTTWQSIVRQFQIDPSALIDLL